MFCDLPDEICNVTVPAKLIMKEEDTTLDKWKLVFCNNSKANVPVMRIVLLSFRYHWPRNVTQWLRGLLKMTPPDGLISATFSTNYHKKNIETLF